MDSEDTIAFLRGELASEDIGVRVNAVYRLSAVRTLLSPGTLLSLLRDILDNGLDEEIYALSRIMDTLPVDSPGMVDVLMKICSNDETMIRMKGVESIGNIGEHMPEDNVIECMVPLGIQLCTDDRFTCKCSGLGILARIYNKAGEWKVAIRR